MTERVILAGGGGHALSVGSLIEELGHEIAGYTDVENRNLPWTYLGNDELVLRGGALRESPVAIGIGTDTAIRSRVFEAFRTAGARIMSVVAPNACISTKATLGDGAVVFPFAYVGPQAVLEENVLIGPGAIVEHGNRVGAHCYLAPGAVLGGNVTLGRRCMLGLNAAVRDGIPVADDTLVGAGSTVVKPIDVAGGIWAGVPARQIRSAQSLMEKC